MREAVTPLDRLDVFFSNAGEFTNGNSSENWDLIHAKAAFRNTIEDLTKQNRDSASKTCEWNQTQNGIL